MSQKIVTRVCNHDETFTDTVLVCVDVDEKMLKQCFLATRMVIELENEENGCAPAEAIITVPAVVFEGVNMDEGLRDYLWDEYNGITVDTFPKVNEDPIDYEVQLVIGKPSIFCVWVHYKNDEQEYSQPIGWLSKVVLDHFLKE